MNRLYKLQRFIRQCLGLNHACRIKPVLIAATLTPISLLVRKGTLGLLRNCVLSNPLAGTLYCKLYFPMTVIQRLL